MSDTHLQHGGTLTDRDYWAPSWEGIRLPRTLDLSIPVMRELAWNIKRYAGLGPGARVLEVGCAASAWLPFFHRNWGWHVEGIDYTHSGYLSAKQNLEMLSVPGIIYEADVFDFAPANPDTYDLVMSYGVVEHFADPTEILKAMHDLLRAGGRIIVIIPHLHGLGGALQRIISRSIYNVHNPLSLSDLRSCLAQVGFHEVEAKLVGREPLMLLNYPARNTLSRGSFDRVVSIRKALDRVIATLARTLRLPSKWMATYVLACGRK